MFDILSEVRKLSMAPSIGSEAQVSKIQKIVDRMFNDNSGANKGPSSTISDRFFTQPAITDAKLRLKHFEQGHESLALDPSHWTNRITRASIHAPGSPFIGERIWAG